MRDDRTTPPPVLPARSVMPLADFAVGRRSFCRTVAAGAGLVALAVARPGRARADGGVCADGAQVYDTAMAATDFANGTATFFMDSRLFVCRDDGGLYALTSVCTHNGCDVGFDDVNVQFACPCHGSKYDFNGGNVVGPAVNPLVHYALCLTGGGTIAVTSTLADPDVRVDF